MVDAVPIVLVNDVPIDIYSNMLNDRIIFLNTVIDDDIGSNIIMQLLYLNNKHHNEKTYQEDIKFMINSDGGDLLQAFAIIDVINYITCDVKTICVGKAYSAAQLILSSGTKGKRYSFPSSRIMQHSLSSGVSGNMKDIDTHVKEMNNLHSIMINLLSKNTGKTKADITKDLNNGDKYFSSNEAIEYGIIDEIYNKNLNNKTKK